MKLKLFLIVALASVCLGTSAQKVRKKKLEPLPAKEKVQPVTVEAFSYAAGLSQAQSLKAYLAQQLGIDTAYVSFTAQALLDANKLTDEQLKQQEAYAAGLQIAKMNKDRVIPSLNEAATGKADTVYTDGRLFAQGLADYLLNKNTMSPDSAMKLVEAQIEYYQEAFKRLNADFLVANAKKKGVKTTESGLQYSIIKQGTGAVATDTTDVEVHYEGRLIDGKVFDSSYKRGQPATFKPSQVIKGWTEALKLMPEGSIYELYIPYNLGYGERGAGENIPPFATLIFKVEVLKVK